MSFISADLEVNISHNCHLLKTVLSAEQPLGGDIPLYELYRYVRPQRVWFFSPLGHK